jgi:acyl-CoA synthetase (AMP-forming)/AMP-acid ligase II
MEDHKIPAIIVFIHEIPRTPTGKILKKELREMLKEISPPPK